MRNKAALNRIAVFFLPLAALAGDCRFTLPDQSNWEGKSGLYVDLENTTSGSAASCRMQDMTIAVGVADGIEWRFIVAHPQWTLNHQYTAKAVITPAYFDLYLDELRIGHVEGGFVGLPDKQLLTNAVPSWATSPAGYLVTEVSLGGSSASGATIAESFQADTRPVPLALLAPEAISRTVPFPLVAGDSFTITAAFTLTSMSADLRTYAPDVDTYGQSVHANFPGKIHTDADLQTAASEEQAKLAAWGMPAGFDAWGGVLNAGCRDAATGFFHVVQHNSVWWLISPAGNPCFYIGLDTGPLTTEQYPRHRP